MEKTTLQHLESTARALLRRYALGIGALLAVIYLGSGFYKISESEIGVVQRFGKVIDGSVGPGAHYRIPWPVDRVTKVPVRTTHTLEITDLSLKQSPAAARPQATQPLSAYCITGDNNIVFIDFLIRYNIVEPVKYLFILNSGEDYLRHIASAAAVQSLATKTVDDILTVGKKSVEVYLKEEIQKRLDLHDTGLGVGAIEIGDVSPHRGVRTFFERVINAQIQQREVVNNAESYANENLPRAKGEASRILEEAEAYKFDVVSRAEGDADRFKKQYDEYRKAKTVTRQRLYLDFIQRKFPELKRIVLVDNSGRQRVLNLRMLSN